MSESIITIFLVCAVMVPIAGAFYNRVLDQERAEELRLSVEEIKELLKKREGAK